VSLLEQVTDLLTDSEIPACLIGAAAMAAHGVPRSTLDLDLLTTDARTLDESLWAPLEQAGAEVEVRRGDHDDPLDGVVRIAADSERTVDLIVGRYSWQSRIIDRARPVAIQGARITVAEPADLVLLKLYAAGPQDRWDIQQILGAQEAEGVLASVEERLEDLPPECSALWRSLRTA